MLASTHLHPAVSIPLALATGLWIVWYWWRLGKPDVPASRRKIRRMSLSIIFLSLPMFVRALSFIDPAIQQREYVINWLLIMLMLLIVMVTAGLDAINNLRLHQDHQHEAIREAAYELARQIHGKRTNQLASSRPTSKDEPIQEFES